MEMVEFGESRLLIRGWNWNVRKRGTSLVKEERWRITISIPALNQNSFSSLLFQIFNIYPTLLSLFARVYMLHSLI